MQLSSTAIIRNSDYQPVRNGTSAAGHGLSVQQSRTLLRFPSINLNPQALPPCSIRSFMRTDLQMEAIGRNPAMEVHSKELALLVTVGLSIILVKCPAANLPHVNTQGQLPLGSFASTLNQWSERKNRSPARKHWQCIQSRLNRSFQPHVIGSSLGGPSVHTGR